MKTLFTIPMLILIVVSGFVSLNLFESNDYGFSALLTLTSYLSIILLVTLLKSKKMILQ
jgi:ABC-type sugar transport system permease subunit